MIYLVGGAPRVGKTQLVSAVISRHPMHAISTDAVRYMLRRTVPSNVLPQTLMADDAEDLRLGNLQRILESQNAESTDLWPYLEQLMNSYVEDNYDLLLEGVAIIPNLVRRLSIPCRAIILNNSAPKHIDTVLRYAADNPYDWLHKFTLDQMATYTDFFSYMGSWLQVEAAEYDIPFVEVHDELFGADIATAADILLS